MGTTSSSSRRSAALIGFLDTVCSKLLLAAHTQGWIQGVGGGGAGAGALLTQKINLKMKLNEMLILLISCFRNTLAGASKFSNCLMPSCSRCQRVVLDLNQKCVALKVYASSAPHQHRKTFDPLNLQSASELSWRAEDLIICQPTCTCCLYIVSTCMVLRPSSG